MPVPSFITLSDGERESLPPPEEALLDSDGSDGFITTRDQNCDILIRAQLNGIFTSLPERSLEREIVVKESDKAMLRVFWRCSRGAGLFRLPKKPWRVNAHTHTAVFTQSSMRKR